VQPLEHVKLPSKECKVCAHLMLGVVFQTVNMGVQHRFSKISVFQEKGKKMCLCITSDASREMYTYLCLRPVVLRRRVFRLNMYLGQGLKVTSI
jgi:hypothetical protein